MSDNSRIILQLISFIGVLCVGFAWLVTNTVLDNIARQLKRIADALEKKDRLHGNHEQTDGR